MIIKEEKQDEKGSHLHNSGSELACFAGRHGTGSGKRYKGDFKNDLPHGYGKLTSADGTVYEGMFRSGRRNGAGTI
ncbi:MAG: hypothetical protein D3913_15425, partial [Candidatus Electrothrix sp. LOE1_4_5]|nr:hypothetical protein [Candidatus Electrothrix gigas]